MKNEQVGLSDIHERLGDEYLSMMDRAGYHGAGPVVAWLTKAADPVGETIAVILWDDGEEVIEGTPRSMLPEVVALRVQMRLLMASHKN